MSSLEQIEALELKLNSVDLTDDNNLKPLEIIKKKKVLSQKQLDVLANAREKLKAKNSERTAKKKLEADAIESEIQSRLSQYKEGLENKIVKKAISIKKRQIKKEAALDDISDDETTMEKIKQIAKKIPVQPPIEQKPKYLYV